MGDIEMANNCRLELSENDMKTSTQIGHPYNPAKTITYEKQPVMNMPKIRVDPAFKVGTVYTPHDGLKTTYNETYTLPIQDGNFNISNNKLLKQARDYSKSGSQRKPLKFELTEYKEEYPVKPLPPTAPGISIEKRTTCPMVLTGRDERDPLPLTENFYKYLDIYLSTYRLTHRAFTLQEQKTIAAKDIVTSQETMDIPKGRGFGCRFPAFSGQDLDKRDEKMFDKVLFNTEQKLRFIPKGMPKVPNFGSESETQAAYKLPEGVATSHLFDRFIEFPQTIGAPTAKQTLCSPGMYTTESHAINNHTSPQVVL